MIADIYAKNRTRVPNSEGGRGREHLGFYVTAFTLGNLTHHRRQPKPPTTTVTVRARDSEQVLRPSKRLQQVRTTEQRKFRLARSRLKG